ncbi:hypothetical protein HZS_6744 [Henneguya salminicola]|uniref:E3 ubiquitin-protein ligase PPP1R11 n=1 Tax=Henneguya salminicola TaxID=69463 RepID=A0A6G3MJW6_HENSL|nr:hypothetical protein HZS_6744 [Henneguya salminicola]
MQREFSSSNNVAQVEETRPPATIIIQAEVTSRRVQFSDDTIDNENLNRKSSKCCCVYRKPRKPSDTSSSSSEEECDGNCWMAPKHYHKNCSHRKEPKNGATPI